MFGRHHTIERLAGNGDKRSTTQVLRRWTLRFLYHLENHADARFVSVYRPRLASCSEESAEMLWCRRWDEEAWCVGRL